MKREVGLLRTRSETVVDDLHNDFLWYPTIGRARIRAFAATPWGRLFERY